MPYTTKELLDNDYFQTLVNSDEKEYELRRDSAMVKADITGSGIPFEIDGVLQSYEDVRSGLGLEQPDQYISKPLVIRNHNIDNETLDEVIDRDFTLTDKPFLKIKDGTFIKKNTAGNITDGLFKFCLYQDEVKYPVRNEAVLRVYGKEMKEVVSIDDELYDSISLGPRIEGGRLRNTDALLGAHRDSDFKTPLFAKPDEQALELVRERINQGKSIVENLYEVTGQLAKSADQVALLAKHILGEPLLPTAGDIARETDRRQYESDFNKEIKSEGALARDKAVQNKRTLVGVDDVRGVTGNSSRPAPGQTPGDKSFNTQNKIGF